MSEARYDLELMDVTYIVERYQERSMTNNPIVGVMAINMAVVESSRQILSIASSGFDLLHSSGPKKPMSGFVDDEELLGPVACQDGTSIEESPGVDAGVGPIDVGLIPHSPLTPEPVAEDEKDQEKCIDCDLKFQFDFEFKPIFALEGLADLIASINNAIDQLMSQLDPFSFIEGLCPFFDNWSNDMCKWDLSALLGLLSMLLQRYTMTAFELAINWSTVLGPIIKLIVDLVADFVEAVWAIIAPIFDCMRAYLNVLKTLQQQLLDIAGTAADLAQSISPLQSIGRIKDQTQFGQEPGVMFAAEPLSKLREYTLKNPAKEPTEGFWKAGFVQGMGGKASFDGALGYMNAAGKREYNIPLSNSITYRPTLEKLYGIKKDDDGKRSLKREKQQEGKVENWTKKQINKGGGFVDNLLGVVNSSEDYLRDIFSSIIFAIKSLNNMITGNFQIQVKLGGLILFVVDMYNLVTWLLKDGVNMFSGNMCKSLNKNDFVGFQNLLETLYGVDNVLIEGSNGRYTIDDSIYDIDVIKCSSLDNARNEFEEKEKERERKDKIMSEGFDVNDFD